MNIANKENIQILKSYFPQADWCGISNQDDFSNLDIDFKYKIVNPKKQLSKVCDFISQHHLEYDWFIKTRPEIKLLESVDLSAFSQTSINARARSYRGHQRIKYGMAVNGPGRYKDIGDCFWSLVEEIVLDDQIYFFHRNIINQGAFKLIPTYPLENEWTHAKIWKQRGIAFKIIGLNACLTNHQIFSGDLIPKHKFIWQK